MKKILCLIGLWSSMTQAQTITSPVPNLSNELLLNKSQTYVYLYNSGQTQITTSLSIPSNPQGVSIAINRCASIKAKQSCYMIISFNGYKTNTPSFSVALNNNSTLLTTLRYNANIVESLSVNPMSLSLGTITTTGLTAAQSITVTNTGNSSISPVVSSSNSNLQISSNTCLSVILPSNTCSFSVRYNAQNSTSNGALSGLSVSVSPSISGSASVIPVSGTLDLAPVLISASEGSVSSGGAVSADKYLSNNGLVATAYNPTSNIFYNWGGYGFQSSQNTPQPISIGANLGGKQLKKIASSSSHHCAIATDDQAYCWGTLSFYGLGYDTSITYPQVDKIPTPVKRTGALAGKTIKDIGVGQNFTCAIASDDKVYCWGLNTYGEIGQDDTVTYTDEPTLVYMGGALAGKTVKSLNVEKSQACVIASDNLAYCWGYSYANNLGLFTPTQIQMNGTLAGKTVKSLSTAGTVNCLVASDEKPYCWGYGAQGQLTPLMVDSVDPVPISLGGLAGKIIKEIKTGGSAVYALTEDSKVFSWGANYTGQLGIGPSSDVNLFYEPTEIYMSGHLAGKTVKSLYTGSFDDFACLIASDNQIYCWGRNLQNGTGTAILGTGQTHIQLPYSLEPLPVFTGGALAGKQIKSLSIHSYNSSDAICSLASDNNIYCWGGNRTGVLGNGTYTSSLVPVLAPTP